MILSQLDGCEVVCPSRWVCVCLLVCVYMCVCMCVCVYSSQPQCVTKALVMLRTCVCVWLCVSGCISTDLPAPAAVRHAVFPILQTLGVRRERRAMFHLNAVIYWLFSFSSFPSLILLVKQSPWEKKDTFCISFSSVDYILWISGKANDHVLWLKK